jgi:hypothetical protein
MESTFDLKLRQSVQALVLQHTRSLKSPDDGKHALIEKISFINPSKHVRMYD